MDKKSLIAPCGLDCFNCGAYVENVTEAYKAKVAQARGMSPDEVACAGCRALQGKVRYAGLDCASWKCAQAKGVEYCFECADFPCSALAPTAQGAAYPHNMKVYNLCRMKKNGLEAWIAESALTRKKYYEGKFVVGKGPLLEGE